MSTYDDISMQISNFKLVSDMNTAFGNPKGDPTAIDLYKIKSQCKNILDEYNELIEAIDRGNLEDIRDALCDIHVFAYGAHHLMGIDADVDMATVVNAVMTRFIKNPDDRLATLISHSKKGVTDVYFEGDYPTMIMKSGSDQPDAPKGKFLKSSSYSEPKFYSGPQTQIVNFILPVAEGSYTFYEDEAAIERVDKIVSASRKEGESSEQMEGTMSWGLSKEQQGSN